MKKELAEEQEINDVIFFLRILKKSRIAIAALMVVSVFSGVLYYYNLPDIYKTQVLVLPAKGSGSQIQNLDFGSSPLSKGFNIGGSDTAAEKALAKLQTRRFLVNFVNTEKIGYVFFRDKWDFKHSKWKVKEPSTNEIYILLNDMINIKRDRIDREDKSNAFNIEFTWKDPGDINLIAEISNNLINKININEKKTLITLSRKNIKFLKSELLKTDIISFKVMINNLIEANMKNIVLASTTDESALIVIDEAVNPDGPERKSLIFVVLLSILAGLVFGAVYAVVNYKMKVIFKTT